MKRNGGVLWEDRCGVVGKEGCRNNDQTKGTVAKHTITLSLSKPLQPQVTDNPPNVRGMEVSRRNITEGEEIEICYSVVDDRGLKQVELWREDVGRQGFREINRRSLSGTEASGCFSDRPSYLQSIHKNYTISIL